MTKEELLAERTNLKVRITELDQQYAGAFLDPESTDGQEFNTAMARVEEVDKIVAQLGVREAHVRRLSDSDTNVETGASFHTPKPGVARGEDIYDLSTIRMNMADPTGGKNELHERAKRAIEISRFPHENADQAKCKERVDRLLANDGTGEVARRILATGSAAYQRAFGKALTGQPLQGSEFSALSVGTGSTGGFAVPYVLDPTIIPTSNLAVNPLRAISREVQLVGSNEWRGVSSAGVTAHRRNEGDESADDSPTLAQPTVRPTRVDVFVPFSVELQEDWGSLQTELARLIQDAKDVEEATSFVTGNGTAPNPEGLITNLVANTAITKTAATATFASTDLDLVEEALGARFRARAQWVGNRATYNAIRHFATNNGPDLWVRIAEGLQAGGNTGQTILGYAANESSAMDTGVTTSGKNLLVLGDFQYFAIVDRIGMQVELVQHLFGTDQRPTGQRGFYAWWRNASKVLAFQAFEILQVR